MERRRIIKPENYISRLKNMQRMAEDFAEAGDVKKTADTLFRIGREYHKLKKIGFALENYENALELYREEGDPMEAHVSLCIGRAHEMEGRLRKAHWFYNMAASRFRRMNDIKNESEAIIRSAKVLEKLGKHDEALEAYQYYNRICMKTQDKVRALVTYAKIRDLEEQLSSEIIRYNTSVLLLYLALIILAEYLTSFISFKAGLVLHTGLLFALFIHSSLSKKRMRVLLAAMMMLPLIRIIGLSMPLGAVKHLYWYIIIALPLFAASGALMRIQKLTMDEVGLNLRKLRWQVPVALTGFPMGYIEYQILRPDALIPSLSPVNFLTGFLVMLIGTGFAEELLFRGILQRNAEKVMGPLPGLLYASLLFTALHVGWKSGYDLIFVFSVAIVYGFAFQRTDSISGITVSHGISNSILFLVMPFL